MNGMTGTCPECEAELAPGARFCPRCGGFAGIAAYGPMPGGQPTVTQQAMGQPPQWPGGPGRTVAAPVPGGGVRVPRAALPAALPAAPSAVPPRAEPSADATMADWSAPPTVTRQPAYPQSPPPFQPFEQAQPGQPQPFQQPGPPTRAEQARYQAPLPQNGPPPGGYPQGGYEPTEYAPGGFPQNGYPPDGYPPDGYPPDGFRQDGYEPTEYAPRGFPQNGLQQGSYPPDDYPPGDYPQGGYEPTEYAPGGYPPRSAVGLGGFEQPPPYPGAPDRPGAPDGPGAPPKAPRQPPRRHDRGRRGVPLALWIAAIVLLAGGAGAALKLTHHPAANTGTGTASGGASHSASSAATPGGTASRGAASGTASAATEQQAAAGVAALLAQSASDRTATNAAATDVASCGPTLKSDPAVFAKAVSSRQALLSKLAAVPGRATLPAALVTDLTGAWQASVAADQAYARWANDELAKACVPNDTADPGFQATVTPNQQATTDKTQFATAWNAVAAKYGLTKYQPGQF